MMISSLGIVCLRETEKDGVFFSIKGDEFFFCNF